MAPLEGAPCVCVCGGGGSSLGGLSAGLSSARGTVVWPSAQLRPRGQEGACFVFVLSSGHLNPEAVSWSK